MPPLSKDVRHLQAMATRLCPVCQSRSIKLNALVAALLQSDARCSNCNSSVELEPFGHSLIWAVAVLSILSAFWLGPVVGIAGAVAAVGVGLLAAPLKADKSDPIALGHALKRKMAQSRVDGDA